MSDQTHNRTQPVSREALAAELGGLLDRFLEKLDSRSDSNLAQSLWDNKAAIVAYLRAPPAQCGVLTATAVRDLIDAADDRNYSDAVIGAGFRARLEIFRPLALSSADRPGHAGPDADMPADGYSHSSTEHS